MAAAGQPRAGAAHHHRTFSARAPRRPRADGSCRGMKVLVTGGAGYIGSHACKALANARHQVLVYDNLSTGHADAVRWGPLSRGDIRDEASLVRILSQWRPDLVMHFAGLAYVGESMISPAHYYDVNVAG